jgi:hypothetical protein
LTGILPFGRLDLDSNTTEGMAVDANELRAADDLAVSLVWADFNRIMMRDRNSLVGMLTEVAKQMTYPSITAGYTPEDHGYSSPRKSRTSWVRRAINFIKG